MFLGRTAGRVSDRVDRFLFGTLAKCQVQLGHVALLCEMINRCIENPVRGKPLADDDPKMMAPEAYILDPVERDGVGVWEALREGECPYFIQSQSFWTVSTEG